MLHKISSPIKSINMFQVICMKERIWRKLKKAIWNVFANVRNCGGEICLKCPSREHALIETAHLTRAGQSDYPSGPGRFIIGLPRSSMPSVASRQFHWRSKRFWKWEKFWTLHIRLTKLFATVKKQS